MYLYWTQPNLDLAKDCILCEPVEKIRFFYLHVGLFYHIFRRCKHILCNIWTELTRKMWTDIPSESLINFWDGILHILVHIPAHFVSSKNLPKIEEGDSTQCLFVFVGNANTISTSNCYEMLSAERQKTMPRHAYNKNYN